MRPHERSSDSETTPELELDTDPGSANDSQPSDHPSPPFTDDTTVSQLPVDDAPVMDFAVRTDVHQGRQGNFLFTVGNPGSGKSTLQNFLVYALHRDPTLDLEYADAEEQARHDANLNTWIQNFARGILPKRTAQGQLQEFRIAFSRKGRPKLDFGFIEISGEDIRSILPDSDGTQPHLHPKLEQYLRLARANRRFIFVSDATENRRDGGGRVLEEDFLFTTLIRYLLSEQGMNLRKLNILFMASKWDAVATQYRSAQQYFNTHFTQTRALVDGSSRITASYIPFSVGTIRTEKDANGDTVARVESTEAKYIQYVVSWIYYNFKNVHLGPPHPRVTRTLWAKIKDWFA